METAVGPILGLKVGRVKGEGDVLQLLLARWLHFLLKFRTLALPCSLRSSPIPLLHSLLPLPLFPPLFSPPSLPTNLVASLSTTTPR